MEGFGNFARGFWLPGAEDDNSFAFWRCLWFLIWLPRPGAEINDLARSFSLPSAQVGFFARSFSPHSSARIARMRSFSPPSSARIARMRNCGLLVASCGFLWPPVAPGWVVRSEVPWGGASEGPSGQPPGTSCGFLAWLFLSGMRNCGLLVASCGFLWPPVASWCFLVPPGASWCLLVLPGASWCLLMPPGASWCLLLPSGASWCLLVLEKARALSEGTFRIDLNPKAKEVGWSGVGRDRPERALNPSRGCPRSRMNPLNPKP